MRARIFAISTVGLLTACSSALLSAEPLEIVPADLAAAAGGNNKREYLGTLVYQSEQKCTVFLNNLVASVGYVNTIGDITSGILSGVATFTTPIGSSHILSGASTIVTGGKTAITSDFYAKASIANFETALQQSYFKSIGDYASALENVDEAKLIVSIEAGKIQGIHSSCGLAPAEAAIQATIAPKTGGTTGGGAPVAAPVPPAPAPPAPAPAPPGLLQGGRISQTPYMVPGSPLR
jgi:hypothetical protein